MDLTGVEQEILVDLLKNGHNVSGNVAENIDRSRTHVSESLGSLEDKGLVEEKGRRVYRPTEAGIEMAMKLLEN